MTNTWWTDVGGQVVSGVIVLVIAGGITALTPWGKRVRDRVVGALRETLKFAASVRVTTRPRIDAEVSEAVRQAAEPDPDPDDEERPLRLDEYQGWVMLPADAPRTWMLRNQTGEAAVVEMIMMDINANFEWMPPDFPIKLKTGESILFPARRIRPAYGFMPFMDRPQANVLWEDSHGDQREDMIWIVVNR